MFLDDIADKLETNQIDSFDSFFETNFVSVSSVCTSLPLSYCQLYVNSL